MKNKIIFILVFTIIVAAGISSMVFLTKKGSPIGNIADIESKLTSEPLEEKIETPAAELAKEIPQHNTIDTDYFNLILVSGWEVTSEENTLPIVVVDSQDGFVNEKAKEINFQTNLSINKTDLGENLFKAYVDGVKTSLINTIPIIEITKEEETAVGDREAYFMEIESIQDDLKFSTFVVLVAGKENTVWAFSFNTLEESWLKYKGIFYKIIEGLEMK